MKKGFILLAILFMASSLPALAQERRISVEGGAMINNSTWDFSDRKVKSVGGFNAGVRAEFEIYENVWIQSGLVFTTKGSESQIKNQPTPEFESYTRDITTTYRPLYLEVPILVAYKFRLSPSVNLFAAAGGFVAQGLTGEYNYKLKYNRDVVPPSWADIDTSESSFSKGGLKRFDAGLSAGVGLEWGRITFRVTHDWSMLNIVKDKAIVGTDTFKNRSLSIAVGLRLF